MCGAGAREEVNSSTQCQHSFFWENATCVRPVCVVSGFGVYPDSMGDKDDENNSEARDSSAEDIKFWLGEKLNVDDNGINKGNRR